MSVACVKCGVAREAAEVVARSAENIAMRAMRLGMLLGMRECLPYIPRGMATDKGSKVN